MKETVWKVCIERKLTDSIMEVKLPDHISLALSLALVDTSTDDDILNLLRELSEDPEMDEVEIRFITDLNNSFKAINKWIKKEFQGWKPICLAMYKEAPLDELEF